MNFFGFIYFKFFNKYNEPPTHARAWCGNDIERERERSMESADVPAIRFTEKVYCSMEDRVKAVDFHPELPWIALATYGGNLCVWNFDVGAMIKKKALSGLPLRAIKFVASKNWILAAGDDCKLYVVEHPSWNVVRTIDVHNDYVRSIAVHPTKSLVLTCSDDMSVALWDWEKEWTRIATYDGHEHYVMGVVFDPENPDIFISVSLDRSIKVWSAVSCSIVATIAGVHAKGINAVCCGPAGLVLTGSDGLTCCVMDYRNTDKESAVLQGHADHVTAVGLVSKPPAYLTASEDGTLRGWGLGLTTLAAKYASPGGRCWCIATRGSLVALGSDEGFSLLEVCS